MTDTENTPRTRRGRPRAFNDVSDQNIIKSLDRALTLLTTVATSPDTTLTDLARQMDESPATMYRALFTFQKHGFVDVHPDNQTWHIGPEAFRVGSAFLRRTSLIERTRPILRQLMESTGETANLGIEADGHVLFVAQVETHAPIRAFFPPGTKSSAHASGIGKVLLANMGEDQLKRVLSGPMQAFTDKTLSDKNDLLRDLITIRERGYSVDDEERNIGMRCIAAPIQDVHGTTVAGISVSGPTSRISLDQIDPLAAKVTAAAREVSEHLGYQNQGKA